MSPVRHEVWIDVRPEALVTLSLPPSRCGAGCVSLHHSSIRDKQGQGYVIKFDAKPEVIAQVEDLLAKLKANVQLPEKPEPLCPDCWTELLDGKCEEHNCPRNVARRLSDAMNRGIASNRLDPEVSDDACGDAYASEARTVGQHVDITA